MLLKNLMEDKQLDFNQPLLSVRRFSSTPSTSEAEGKRKCVDSSSQIPPLPVYRSELKSGPVRNPGTVPFIWERTPGRPRNESTPQFQALQRTPIAPKLPPGRIFDAEQQSLVKDPQVTTVTLSPSEKFQALQRPPIAPKLPPGSIFDAEQQCLVKAAQITTVTLSPSENCSGKIEPSVNNVTNCLRKVEDYDDAYVDALDTLSQTESFYSNCNISCVSGSDVPDSKPSGIFLTDPQTRDLMMGRFLPAAKALALETPSHAARKQPIAEGKPREINKAGGRPHPHFQISPKNVSHYPLDQRLKEREIEDAKDATEISAAGVCGLIPQFRLNNLFSPLNPMPGHAMDAIHEKWGMKGLQNVDLQADKIKLKRESDQITYERSKLNGSTSSSSDVLGIPEKLKKVGVNGINAHGKGSNYFQESSYQECEWDSCSGSPVPEKTLYIDSISRKSSHTNLYSTDLKELTGRKGYPNENYRKTMNMKETRTICYSLGDIKHINVDDGKAVPPPKSDMPRFPSFQSTPDIQTRDVPTNGCRKDENLIKNCIKLGSSGVGDCCHIDLEAQLLTKIGSQENPLDCKNDPIIVTSSEITDNGKPDLELQQPMKSSNKESRGCNLKPYLHPPLPKSPSESWLKRTLPNVSRKGSSTRFYVSAHIDTKVQSSNMPTVDPNWETIVKTSNVQHRHSRFPAELLDPITEA